MSKLDKLLGVKVPIYPAEPNSVKTLDNGWLQIRCPCGNKILRAYCTNPNAALADKGPDCEQCNRHLILYV